MPVIMLPVRTLSRIACRCLVALPMAAASVALAAPPLPPPPQPVAGPAPQRAPVIAPTSNAANRGDRPERQATPRDGRSWTPEDMRAMIASILSRPINDLPIIDDSVTGIGNPDLWEAAPPVRMTSNVPVPPRAPIASP